MLNTAITFSREVYKITVALDSSGDYTSIQKAIDASKSFPCQRVTIFVKNGIYKEKIVVPACNTSLSIIGEDAVKTIITSNDFFGKMNRGRNSTFYTCTLLVIADDFYAENLTIENSAGSVGQAIALYVKGDRCVFRNCRKHTPGQNLRLCFYELQTYGSGRGKKGLSRPSMAQLCQGSIYKM